MTTHKVMEMPEREKGRVVSTKPDRGVIENMNTPGSKLRTKYTRMLDNITKEDFSDVGGKGANLGEMIAAGLPVPGGFVILTDSYRRFLEANNLTEKISALLGELDDEDAGPEVTEKVAEIIRDLFNAAVIPAEIIQAIDEAYQQIGEPAVAVRSSATAEDLPGTSFAGQYNTYLNVQGREELYIYIKECWASLWNYRALSYRVRQGIPNDGLAHGVVVQKMINSHISGILFTANPVNGRRDQMLLNASWGLGEAVVGGEVTPDQWIIEKSAGRIVEERISKKEVMTVRKKKGIEFVPVPDEKKEQVTLSEGEVKRLLDFGLNVERYFGSPQDIEWAFLDGEFYLVQTRPVTSLYPLPRKVEGRENLRIHVNMSMLSQGMQEPFTPMGEHVYVKSVLVPVQILEKRIKDEDDLWWYQSIGGRIFIDYTELLRDERKWEDMIINDYFSDQEPLTAKSLLLWLEKNKAEITAEKSKMVSFILRKMIPLTRLLFPMAAAMGYGTLFPLRAREKALRDWNRAAREAREGVKDLKTNEEKLAYIDQHIDRFNREGWVTLSLISPSFRNVEKAEKMAAPFMADTADFRLVEKSLPYNATTEMGLRMMNIARALDERGERATPEQAEIREFFDEYGHRSVEEVDIGIPRWDEQPEYVLGLINSYIDHKSYRQGLDNFERGVAEAEAAINRIKTQLEKAGKKKLAVKVEKKLRDYREVFGLREESKFTLTQVYHVCRRLLIEVGADLVAQGKLDDRMDIFFVRVQDVRSGGNLQPIVKTNKENYQRQMNMAAPRLLSSTGESIYAAAELKDGALCGIPVSAGVYEGRARILHSPEEGGKLEKGDVLITRGTNPAWTPMFLNLGAIVMETGGPISHGAVVAREYGVPAVVGVGEATSLIKEGQMVRVNGETGQVELL